MLGSGIKGARPKLKALNDRLWASLKDAEVMVQLPSSSCEPGVWTGYCFRCVRSAAAHNPLQLAKQLLVGDCLQDDPAVPLLT